MKLRILFIFFLFFAIESSAQKLIFENIGIRSGLPSTEIYHVHQDKKGYIWIFTEYGIVKYNGSSFLPVCQNLDQEKIAAYAVEESPSGDIYFANSKAEIYRIHNDRAYKLRGEKVNKITKLLDGSGLYISSLFFQSDGTMWLATTESTHSVKSKDYFFRGISKELFGNRDEVFIQKKIRLKLNSKDITGAGFPVFNGEIKSQHKGQNISAIRQLIIGRNVGGRAYSYSAKNCAYISENEKIVGLINGKMRQFDFGQEIISFKVASNGHVWVGTSRGLYELDKNLHKLNAYFENFIVSDLLFDNQNGLWVTTIGNGMYHCLNINHESFHEAMGRDERVSMLKHIGDILFIGTYNGRFFKLKRNILSEVKMNNQVLSINDIEYAKNHYYLATNRSFFVSTNGIDFKDMFPNWNLTINSIEPIDEHTILLASGRAMGRIDIDSKRIYFSENCGKTRSLVARKRGEIYSLIRNHICCLTETGPSYPEYLKPMRNILFTKIVLDREGNIWLCSRDKGVYQLDKNNHILRFQNLPSLITKDLLFLSTGDVILATNTGAYISAVSGMNKKASWKKISDEELTGISEFGDRIYLGTRTGLLAIKTPNLNSGKGLRFYISSVKTGDGKVFRDAGILNLKRNQNELFLQLDYLNFGTRIRSFRYVLQGASKEQGTISGNQLHLQNLKFGDYYLKVYPISDDNSDEKMFVVKRFTIQPAFWETTVFIVGAGFVFLLILFFVYRFFLNLQIKRKKTKEVIEKQLNEYRLTALKSQINPHFMSNSLVAIQNLILQNETDNANLYLAKFSLLLRSLLEYSNKSAASLAGELSLIELYVELEQLRFSNKFVFDLDISDEIDLDETVIPTLITQPFVENAIWHGLLPLNDHSNAKLTLKIEMDSKDLKISIIDNGVGRTHHERESKSRISRGTELIVTRIETLNQLYHISGGKIEFVDLYDNHGNPSGTRVNIVLPQLMLNELYDAKDS